MTIKINYSQPAGLGSQERNYRVLVMIIMKTLAETQSLFLISSDPCEQNGFPGALSTTKRKWNQSALPVRSLKVCHWVPGPVSCTHTCTCTYMNKHSGSCKLTHVYHVDTTAHSCTYTSVLGDAQEPSRRPWAQQVLNKCPLGTLKSKPAHPVS